MRRRAGGREGHIRTDETEGAKEVCVCVCVCVCVRARARASRES